MAHACRAGEVAAACGSKKSSLLHRMLTLHFKVEGITYRDCDDAQQAAEHVVGITAAIAKQAYKVRTHVPILLLMHGTV